VKIEAAFNRALKRYQLKPYDGNVLLLRPRLDVIYRLSGGRRLQHGRKLAAEDNGWSAYVSQLTVREVPGNHDSMVLEPNARVIVARIRENLRPVETGRTDARPQQAAE
jgi:thioesterase domain-containing protein